MTRADDTVAAIRRLEQERYRAMLAGDVDTLDGLLSDRLAYAHSNASRDTKESYLGKLRDGAIVYRSVDHGDEQVIVFGDTALVAGYMRGEVELEGRPVTLNNSALAVWVREPDGWVLAGYQPTPLPR